MDNTLYERYKDEIMSDNSSQYEQCKKCAFRDRTTVKGDECGWRKGHCDVYSLKPNSVMQNKEPCDFYTKG